MSTSHSASQGKEKQKATQRPLKSQLGSDDTPLWNHVNVLSIPVGGGGNRTWSCNYCNKKVTGSYSKVKAHLMKLSNYGVEGCKTITDDLLLVLKREHNEAEQRKAQAGTNARRKSDFVSLPQESDLVQQKRQKGCGSGALAKAFNVIERDEADKLAARMFYTSALPFNFARNPYFRSYSKKLANGNLSGYSPPTFDRLRTTLLAQEKSHINRLLQPIKDTWKKKGVSIVSDGWSDRQRRPIINIMAASSGGPMFLKAVDASGEIKDGDYVANLFSEAIREVGEANVVQIVTDNAANYRAAGLIIEEKYPNVFWTPCVVHSLNLALKSMCEPSEKSSQYVECKWIANLVKEVHDIRNFIVNHGMALATFKRYSELNLLRVAETRFASNIIMAKRLKEVKPSLEKMVMDANWKLFRAHGNTIESKAREVKQLIVNDNWWDDLDYFLSFTKPIVDMLRAADKDAPLLHFIYDMWDTMIEDVRAIIYDHEGKDIISGDSTFFNAIHQILVSRWTKSYTPLHCMSHALVPKYYCEAWLEGGSNGNKRLSPHEDEEVSMNRIKCFKRLFSNQNDLRQVHKEYGAFSTGSDFFSQPHVIEARLYEEPISWWANYGASTPLLQALAFKLLSQPASSSCCERNWSIYSLVQSVKRNKLSTTRAEDLVFVHYNLRLLSRKEEDYTTGPTKYWDLCGEASLEDAELSLDEPELEKMMLNADDGGEFDDTQDQERDEHNLE